MSNIIISPTYSLTTKFDLIDAFLHGRSEKTIEAYRKDLADFCTFLGASSLDDAAKRLISCGPGEANGTALAYKTHLIERGLAPATVNRRLAALRSLVKLAQTLGLTVYTLQVENMRSQSYRDTRGCGRSGFLALLKTARHQKRREKAIRDVAILNLLYCLGLRRGEVVRLQVADVDLANGRLAVLGKGRTQKEFVSLPEQVSRSLSEWLHVRGQDDGPLFHNFDPTSRAGGLTGDGLYKIIRYLGRRAGIKTRPHGLRHAAITEALDLTGGNIRAVARFSRHRNLQTLTVYDDNRLDLAGDIARLVASCASL